MKKTLHRTTLLEKRAIFYVQCEKIDCWGHSQLGNYIWDKRIKDYVALDLSVYYDLL